MHSVLRALLCTAEVTVELNTTTARFTWPLVTSPQVTVSGYTIDIEATDPEGLISIPSALIQSQQNTHLLSDLEEGVRYRFQLYAATTIQQDTLIPNRHEGQFTTDTAGAKFMYRSKCLAIAHIFVSYS